MKREETSHLSIHGRIFCSARSLGVARAYVGAVWGSFGGEGVSAVGAVRAVGIVEDEAGDDVGEVVSRGPLDLC